MADTALATPPGAAPARNPKIRLLIVDDSAVARAVLTRMVSHEPAFEIVEAVSGAHDALKVLARTRVDVILLDIEMPRWNGLAALPDLIARAQGARILIVSALAEEGAAATVEALTLGAADTLAKPGKGSFGGRFAEVLCDRLLRLGRPTVDHLSQRGLTPAPALPRPRATQVKGEPLKCVAIGASTGGLHAIAELLRALPASFDAPILITQHLPAVFMSYFAEQLQTGSGRPTVVARDGMALQAGRIHVAPGDSHLRVERHGGRVVVALGQRASATGCLPSVDPMLESVAAVYGGDAIGVVLSGMGRDGTNGASAMNAAGAELLIQDVESSVVWGMPGSIAKAGLATAVLPPAEIARHLLRRGSR